MRRGAALVALFLWSDWRLFVERAWLGSNFLGLDARIYYRGAQAWLAGQDPWQAGIEVAAGKTFHYAGLPPTVILTAPFTLLPEDVFAALMVLAGIVASLWTLRRYDWPLAFFLFPPSLYAVVSGNPQGFLIPLVLLVPSVAPLVKVYAVFPMLGEGKWRGLALCAAMAAGSVLLFPGLWGMYLADFAEVNARLVTEGSRSWGALSGTLPLGIAVIVVLALIDRRAAGWLAPAIAWPSAQWHYASFALPLRSPLLLALFALPITFPGWPAAATAVYAASLAWKRRNAPAEAGARQGFWKPGQIPATEQR